MYIEVSAAALEAVLQALTGPSHWIRELQATRRVPGYLNPINQLIEQYNSAVTAPLKGGYL